MLLLLLPLLRISVHFNLLEVWKIIEVGKKRREKGDCLILLNSFLISVNLFIFLMVVLYNIYYYLYVLSPENII